MNSLRKLTITWKPSNIPSNSISSLKKICSKGLFGRCKRHIRRYKGPIRRSKKVIRKTET
jgi:hypothetical protein